MCFLKVVLKKLAMFIGKNLCWSLFLTKFSPFNKLQHSCLPARCETFFSTILYKTPPVATSKLLRNPNNPQSMGNRKFHKMGILTKKTNLRSMGFWLKVYWLKTCASLRYQKLVPIDFLMYENTSSQFIEERWEY